MEDLISSALDLTRHLERRWPTALVGGAPRDLLLGQICHDVDLVTAAPLEALVEALSGTRLIGEPPRQSALLPWRGHFHEVVSLGGLSLEEELARRDLTVNALALTSDGALIDVCGGGRDLALRRLRFNGSASDRLAEDPLRALRLLRFSATLPAFSVEPPSFVAASGADLSSTAPDRRGGELLRAAEGDLPLFVDLLENSGLLEQAYPVLAPLRERERKRLARLCALSSDVALRLAALLLDLPLDRALDEALRSWQWPRNVSATVRGHLAWSREERKNLFLLTLADVEDDGDGRRWLEARALALKMELAGLDGKKLLDGETVMAHLGLPPGRAIGKILGDLDDRRARGEITTQAQALAWLKDQGGNLP